MVAITGTLGASAASSAVAPATTAAPAFGYAAMGMQALGALTNAMGQRTAGRVNARLARINAGMMDYQAEQAIQRGKEDESRFRDRISQTIGSQRTGFASQNVDLSDMESSAQAIQEDTAAFGELDALMIRNNARREAFGYRMQGVSGRAQAGFNEAQSSQRAASTLIAGAGNVYGTYRSVFGDG